MDWVLVLRCLNIAGALVCLYFLAIERYRQWSDWNNRTRHDWWAMTAWVILCVESAIEHIILNSSLGPRLLITSAAVIFTLRALLIKEILKAEPIYFPKKGVTYDSQQQDVRRP